VEKPLVTADIAASIDMLELRNAQIHLRPASDIFTAADGFSALSSDSADMPVLECVSAKCRAVISLQGAQILAFCSAGKQELLWLSPLSRFHAGDAIRGGIPVCLPWFGVNRRQADLPKHGLVRTQLWSLDDVQQAEDDTISLRLVFRPNSVDLALFPYSFLAELTIELGTELRLSLRLSNEGQELMPLSFAFHSYFSVSDAAVISLEGVDGCEYLDNCQGLSRFVQSDNLVFDREIDRVYEAVGASQTLIDSHRKIEIDGRGCDTVVIWNPGAVLAAEMDDVGQYYRDYVCVERGMAFGDELKLAAGGVAEAKMTLSSE
jgi:glucose-6-phosphate 1-epimerase